MMRSTWLVLVAIAAAGCEGEMPLTAPGLEGPLTEGRWERRDGAGLTFWPPSPEGTSLPELIDFSCVAGARGEIRVTVTGDVDRTGLWMARPDRTARTLLLETAEGVTALELFAGDNRLPAVQVPVDTPWLQPLLAGEGRFAVNAFGTRTYRLEVSPLILDTIEECQRSRMR